jgi:hypothetical protein
MPTHFRLHLQGGKRHHGLCRCRHHLKKGDTFVRIAAHPAPCSPECGNHPCCSHRRHLNAKVMVRALLSSISNMSQFAGKSPLAREYSTRDAKASFILLGLNPNMDSTQAWIWLIQAFHPNPNNPDLSLPHNPLHVSTRSVNRCPDPRVPVYARLSRVLLRGNLSRRLVAIDLFPDLVSTRWRNGLG